MRSKNLELGGLAAKLSRRLRNPLVHNEKLMNEKALSRFPQCYVMRRLTASGQPARTAELAENLLRTPEDLLEWHRQHFG